MAPWLHAKYVRLDPSIVLWCWPWTLLNRWKHKAQKGNCADNPNKHPIEDWSFRTASWKLHCPSGVCLHLEFWWHTHIQSCRGPLNSIWADGAHTCLISSYLNPGVPAPQFEYPWVLLWFLLIAVLNKVRRRYFVLNTIWMQTEDLDVWFLRWSVLFKIIPPFSVSAQGLYCSLFLALIVFIVLKLI